MKSHHQRPIAESELHALVDGRLTPAAAADLHARIAHDAQAAATVRAWEAQRVALRGLNADVETQPVPPSLVATAHRLAQAHARTTAWWRYGGMAASLAL